MLDVINLNFDYPDKSLLHNIQFTLNAGTLLHLRGGNGTGKTTLIKLLAALLRPDSGDIKYADVSIYDDLAAYQQTICYVGHKNGISLPLTIQENCHFDLHYDESQSINHLIKSFGLKGLEHVSCGLLSVGQRRRVGLLRLLMSKASLWLLDEPLVALDQEAIDNLMSHIQRHLARGGLVILTSHQNLPLSKKQYQEYHL